MDDDHALELKIPMNEGASTYDAPAARWFGMPAKALAPEAEIVALKSSEHRSAKPSVLLELRPALDGFAGIPQETRLLFRGLRMIEDVEVEGMIQASHRILSKGTRKSGLLSFGRFISESTKINRYSRVVISLADRPYTTIIDKILDLFERRLQSTALTFGTLMGMKRVKLSLFRSKYFEDFVWRTLFAKTLPASDFDLITTAQQRICSTPWHTMHVVGLKTLNFLPSPKYPRLDTEGVDIFIAQTPYPGRVNRETTMIVRYHDALPVFMPHTIPDKSAHQATHFYALKNNVKSGAWFACVSEATRQDLLKLFPEAECRAVTIHNMVSQHYFLEASSPTRVGGIIRSRLYEGDPIKGVRLLPDFLSIKEKENFYRRHLGQESFKYLLMVSTIEPRKNHARLLAAWEVIKADVDPDMKLVVVGTLGWDCESMTKAFRPWIDRGELFVLNAVPAPDLRVLYRHATATVCPSLGEGFDFSGIEAMCSGGVVLASDIPVHREVYADASEFFDPYATGSLVGALKKVLYAEDSATVQHQLRVRGQEVSARYLPERILPQWKAFLKHITAQKRS